MSITVTHILCDDANSSVVKLQKVPEYFIYSSVSSGRSKLS